jgi:hypothetical protein
MSFITWREEYCVMLYDVKMHTCVTSVQLVVIVATVAACARLFRC